ncbi:trypsin-like peptidase domain-containing protein [Candidatus Giovannonibacteria bacterium]|nr:trypsin-like peptidase domain-containing protein [Candidatus Giovannonibacteria bacterium]
MDNISKKQIILLVLLVSFVTSILTGVASVVLFTQGAGKPAEVLDNPPRNVEQAIIKIVDNVSPAVVSVIATKDVPVIEQYYTSPFEGDDSFGGFFPDFSVPRYRQKGTERKQVSAGTGFFVSEDGSIITNRHVVEDRVADYSVIMNDGKKLNAKVLARDPVKDIAVLKVDGSDYKYIQLGDSGSLKVGQTVVAIGNALGEFQNTVSVGVISGLSRTITASGESGPEVLGQVIQTDAAINPGNSGGPLLDITGRAIGINSAVASGAENIGFAIPVSGVEKAISDIKAFGKIRYPFLGVRYIVVNPAVKESKKLTVDYGVLVSSSNSGEGVVSNSPAAKAGVKEGDIILEIDGKRVDQNNTLADQISSKKISDKIKLKILRNNKEIFLEAALEERS